MLVAMGSFLSPRLLYQIVTKLPVLRLNVILLNKIHYVVLPLRQIQHAVWASQLLSRHHS